LAVVVALAFQYGVAPYVVESPYGDVLGYVKTSWTDGCEDLGSQQLEIACVGNNAVYRVFGTATLFFLLAAIAAACKPTANREAWPAKYVLFCFGVLAACFIPNTPLFTPIYLNIGRIGGIVFVFIQQVVILDVAYNWNDAWVEKSNRAELDDGPGAGQKWLVAILVSCGVLFALALAALIYMFVAFTGCPTNDAFISVTLVLCVAITAAQLSGEEASLLASACVSLWATYLCYGAVTKNLDDRCNPTLGDPTPATIVLGLVVSVVSMAYTGWSYTAEDKLQVRRRTAEEGAVADETGGVTAAAAATEQEKKKVTGIVTGTSYGTEGDETPQADGGDGEDGERDVAVAENVDRSMLSNSWRLNVAMAAVACFTSMILTHWGSVQSRGTIANPSASNVAMWIVIASQWLVLLLYLWTLIAPRLFPDRDFS